MAKTGNYSTEQLNNIVKDDNEGSNNFQGNQFSTNKFEEEGRNNNYSKDNQIIIKKDDRNMRNSEVIEESLSLAEMEEKMFIKALEKYNGKRKKAADELEISEKTLYRKIKEYNISI